LKREAMRCQSSRPRWSLSRPIALAGVLTALTLSLAVSALWLIEAHQVKATIADWTDRPLAGQFAFSHAAVEIDGFPFHLDVSISEPVLAVIDRSYHWHAPVLRMHGVIWRPNRFDYETAGRVEHASNDADGLVINVPALRGTVEVADRILRHASLRAESVHIGGIGSGDVAVGGVEALIDLMPERAVDLKTDAAELKLSLQAIALVSDQLGSAFKEPISKIDLVLGLTGPLPWDGTPNALTRWRDAGGTFELHELALAWSGLKLEGDGTFALDDQLRPEGAFAFRLDGLQATLQRLTDAGDLSPEFAELIGQHIAELSVPDDRVPGRLLIGVTAQDGRLTVQDHLVDVLTPITGP
jgi:hypothetical protein